MTKGGKYNVENYEKWSAAEFGEYLKKRNLGQYYEVVVRHDVTGKVAPRLSENDLKEMGVKSIGDRKRFQEAVETMQKSARKKEREKVIWQDEEVLWFSCYEAACSTCCGCCPVDPSTYKLTGTHLIIKKDIPSRCGPIRCCCGHEYEVDNVDLTHITDADVKGLAPPCCQQFFCCGKGMDRIEIKTSSDGNKTLKLTRGKGEPVSRKIMNQVEEAQRMERD